MAGERTSSELAELFSVASSTGVPGDRALRCYRAGRACGHSGAVNSDDLADATHAAKVTEALLREARSALRRVEKLTAAALAADDADAHQLAAAAQGTLKHLVDHLVLAKQRRNRAVQRALRQVR